MKGAKTGGRSKGTPNKTKAKPLPVKAAEAGLSPLDFLLGIYRDEAMPLAERMDAAKAAAPYVHAKLASVEHKGDLSVSVTVRQF